MTNNKQDKRQVEPLAIIVAIAVIGIIMAIFVNKYAPTPEERHQEIVRRAIYATDSWLTEPTTEI